VVPTLRKVREGQGTHLVADASKIKSMGHPRQQGIVFSRVLPLPPRSGSHFSIRFFHSGTQDRSGRETGQARAILQSAARAVEATEIGPGDITGLISSKPVSGQSVVVDSSVAIRAFIVTLMW
jgi:hypothetical protein